MTERIQAALLHLLTNKRDLRLLIWQNALYHDSIDVACIRGHCLGANERSGAKNMRLPGELRQQGRPILQNTVSGLHVSMRRHPQNAMTQFALESVHH